MNQPSSSTVARGMRAIAALSLITTIAACGGGSSSDPCSSVAGESYRLTVDQALPDGGLDQCNGPAAVTVTFVDGGFDLADGSGIDCTWSQSTCVVAISCAVSGGSPQHYDFTESDAGLLEGTWTPSVSSCAPHRAHGAMP